MATRRCTNPACAVCIGRADDFCHVCRRKLPHTLAGVIAEHYGKPIDDPVRVRLREAGAKHLRELHRQLKPALLALNDDAKAVREPLKPR